MLSHTTYVIAKENPLRYMISRTYTSTHTTKWIMLLSKFDLEFISQKSIKGQVIANQLVESPLPSDHPLIIELPDDSVFSVSKVEEDVTLEEDVNITLFFDGSKCEQGQGAGVVFHTPQGIPIPLSFKLDFPCTNNNVEYEALILGLQATIAMGIKCI